MLLSVIFHSEESDSLWLEGIAVRRVIWVGDLRVRVDCLPMELVDKHVSHCLVIGEGPFGDGHAIGFGSSVGS